MIHEKTERGFEIVRADVDHYLEFSLQQSSAIGNYPGSYDRPGSSYLWVGVGANRTHLSRDEARELADRLAAWLATGSLRLPGEGACREGA